VNSRPAVWLRHHPQVTKATPRLLRFLGAKACPAPADLAQFVLPASSPLIGLSDAARCNRAPQIEIAKLGDFLLDSSGAVVDDLLHLHFLNVTMRSLPLIAVSHAATTRNVPAPHDHDGAALRSVAPRQFRRKKAGPDHPYRPLARQFRDRLGAPLAQGLRRGNLGRLCIGRGICATVPRSGFADGKE